MARIRLFSAITNHQPLHVGDSFLQEAKRFQTHVGALYCKQNVRVNESAHESATDHANFYGLCYPKQLRR